MFSKKCALSMTANRWVPSNDWFKENGLFPNTDKGQTPKTNSQRVCPILMSTNYWQKKKTSA